MIWTIKHIYIYILSANKEAMALYNKSKDALIESDCYDFMVYKYSSHKNTVMLETEEWDETVQINASIFIDLHLNLCTKFRKFILEPSRKKYLKNRRKYEAGKH